MRELADFQINQNKRAQQTVVENEVNVKMVAVNRDALLAGDERKAFAEFQQKFLQMVEQGLFDIGFG